MNEGFRDSARVTLGRSRREQLPWLDVEGARNLGDPVNRSAARAAKDVEHLGAGYGTEIRKRR
jgi:hypothetical protein